MITQRDTIGQIVYENLSSVKNREMVDYYIIEDMKCSIEVFCKHMEDLAKDVTATGNRGEVEYKMNLFSGETKYFKCTLIPETDETSQVISVLTISRDITDIKEGGMLFQAAFNLNHNCMSVTRQSDHTIIRVNDTFVEKIGLSPDAVEGRTTAELDLWPDKDRFDETYNLLMKQGYLNNHEVQYIARGTIRTGLLSSRKITINGEPCWLNVVTDITEKKWMDAEIARLDSLNLIGEIAASIGHEVRNPITKVMGYLQLFQRRAEFLPYNDQLVKMTEEIDRANAIITEFLSLAKNKNIHLEQGNLNTVVEALCPLMQADASYMGHQLEVSCSPIPDIQFDPAEIRQLILNLFRNSMEAMDLSGMARIRTYATDDAVILEVSDTGKGIPPEIIDKLGTSFFTTKESGTGLGMAVCYRVAQRHGATIDIDSSPAGTTFSIRFKVVNGA